MELTKGQVAVVTGGGSGIGLALAERFATAGMNLVLGDVQDDALATATAQLQERGVDVLAVRLDVSKEAEVQDLAQRTIDHFGAVHLVCNNAGVAARGDPWFGPISSWEWVIDVNFWGVVHGCRAFLPHLAGGGYIVNTASIAGLMPGFSPAYDASKHAVVAITESLFNTIRGAGLPIGVSVLCPGWVRTNIVEADRNWPAALGEKPADDAAAEIPRTYATRAIAEGRTPASVADAVAEAITADRFWIIPHQDFLDLCIDRWASIAERADPQPAEDVPGMPPRSQILAEVAAALGLSSP
jgi:NAD(P)-dependent dehydrogenase (short-subunit alcohol dehydrogenase family)